MNNSEKLYKNLFQNAPLSSIVTDQSDIITELNQMASDFFGHPKEDMLGKSVKNYFIKSSYDQYNFFSYWLHTRNHDFKQGTDIIFYALTRKGQMIPCELGFSKIEHLTLCTFTESSKKQENQIEKEQSVITLQESNERTSRILDTINDGYWEWLDTKKEVVIWNNRQFELLGYEPQEFNPSIQKFTRLLHPEFYKELRLFFEKGIKKGKTFEMELKLLCKDLTYKWFKFKGKPFNKKGNRYKSFSGSIQDIHTQKMAQQAVIKEKKRLSIALDSVKMGVWEWDVKKDVLNWDASMYKIYHLDKATNLTFEEWMTKIFIEDLPQVKENMERSFKTGERSSNNFRIQTADQGYKYIREAHIPIIDKHKGLTGVIGINLDISEEKERERKLKEANKRLEQFIFTISHDVKAPLVTIKSFAQLVLQEKDFNEKVERWLSRIVSNSEHLDRLLDELLELSTVTNKKIIFEKNDLIKIITSAKESIADTIEKSKAQFILPQNKCLVKCHKKLIEQVFSNLFTNAIKYKKENETPIIKIDIKDKEDCLQITVADNGKGINDKHKTLVFKIFERLESIDSSIKGTGIGLSITQSAIEKHGGKIWVESNQMLGSSFKFTLPKQNLQEN